MKITLKLYAMLGDYLPEGSDKHAAVVEIPEDATAHQIIDRFQVPRQLAHLVLVNGVYLEPDERDRPVFKDGDTLAIWPPIAGG